MPLRQQRSKYRPATIRLPTFKQREEPFKTVNTKDKQLANKKKRELLGKHIKDFMKFTNEITLEEINAEQNSRKANC
jgi:hypothetical protein